MAYDKAKWHQDGDFPKDLDTAAAYTHTGLFVAWAILAGLGGEEVAEDFGDEIEQLRERTAAPSQLYRCMDGTFTEEELSEEGNAFTEGYFDLEKGQYLKDYEKTLCQGLPSTFHAADSWENFDKLKPVLDARLASWRAVR